MYPFKKYITKAVRFIFSISGYTMDRSFWLPYNLPGLNMAKQNLGKSINSIAQKDIHRTIFFNHFQQ